MNQTEKYRASQIEFEHTSPLLDDVCPDIIRHPSRFFFLTKRCIDVLGAALALCLFFPLLILIALSIKLDDGGPVLHLREIVGLNGKHFFALKFRTMILDADEYLQRHPDLLQLYQKNMKLMHDPRVTQIGHFLRKTSLDELPQLVNVLLGQMSLVGPRMIHPDELVRYGHYANKRLSVKPGMTGLWQICCRWYTSYDARIVFDMHYIDTRTLLLDLYILCKTVKVFIVHTGA
ncbi:sugar transferase [Dictyobacter arantiisoli]|uniref:Bacterial sugar transferase domain-containing protein n=1 Tax=Dictyobacter arantiisoli TaxID=2014874 RepID=A0A5A5T7G9_9CHLR|nr:sugar transferase [Dictyobacter arantiisoli]GCF06889.1 hypothetical protein KDI_04530 [Dictyobacter arantiisoli]